MNRLLFVLLFLPVLHLRDLDESDGISNFEEYYRCYFDKYFKQADPSPAMGGKREAFVSQLLSAALLSDSLAPSTACVQWMCHPDLVWKIWSIGSTEVWAYYAEIGNTIPEWMECFQDRKTELKNYEKIESGLIYNRFTVLSFNIQEFTHQYARRDLVRIDSFLYQVWSVIIKENSL